MQKKFLIQLAGSVVFCSAQVQAGLLPSNIFRVLFQNGNPARVAQIKTLTRAYKLGSTAADVYTQYTAASLQAQTLASETSWTWATPTPDYAYYTYLNEIYYTPPPSLPLVEISPETPAPRFGNDRRQDSEPPIYVAPEIAAVYAWPLDENQQAVLDIDSWNMWNNEPVCFWSNMLNIYLQAANLTFDPNDTANSDHYNPPCDRYGTGSTEFWWCVYQDLVINAMPSALEFIYYPRTSPVYYLTTCSVLGYPTSTAMYYAMTVPPPSVTAQLSPTSVKTKESAYSPKGTETGSHQSFDVSRASPSAGQMLFVPTDRKWLSVATCIISVILAIILAL